MTINNKNNSWNIFSLSSHTRNLHTLEKHHQISLIPIAWFTWGGVEGAHLNIRLEKSWMEKEVRETVEKYPFLSIIYFANQIISLSKN